MGGGNDGGSIPGRSELVKEKPKELRAESDLVGRFRAKYCALTKERLKKPVAICRLGYLYNYETLLHILVNKKLPKEFSHIRRVTKNNSDVRQIELVENQTQDAEFPIVCPLSQQIYNGRNRFIVLWKCGCYFSEKVIKDMLVKKKTCPACNASYHPSDVVILGLSNEETEMKRAQLMQEQAEEAAAIKREKLKQEAASQQFEDFPTKKVCTQKAKQSIPRNRMQQLCADDDASKNSKIYQSLFHKKHDIGQELFMRNVRYGLR